MITIEKLKKFKESEDKVEFKKGEGGNISYDGGVKTKPSDRRRCILGYVTALCNELGGYLVIGMTDNYPHEVVGTSQNLNTIGELEANIYRDTDIRTEIIELFEDDKRVLVIKVPPRPTGKVFKFEDVALMRVGEELKPMSDEVYLKIINEQEPDFSSQICEGLLISDLDEKAISILKDKYALKQNNPNFRTLSNEQLLSDLDLSKQGKLTNASLILLGKKKVLNEKLPQASVMIEYRNSESQIPFDNRIAFSEPFFIMIEELWNTINLRNGSFPIQDGAYIFNIPFFNEEVIRESINNAITHRDYRKTSEIVVKQFPQRLDIINAGGFPLGVNLENLLKTPSTPRNRLLAEVLQKTGIVERSGQGVDKIFYNTLIEGKAEPDYSKSDYFQVNLKLSAVIEDRAFALFIVAVQEDLPETEKLSVLEVITLNLIKRGTTKYELDSEIVSKLLNKKLIEKRGKTNAIYYILSKDYYEFTDEKAKYYNLQELDEGQVFNTVFQFLLKEGKAKMKDFVGLFEDKLSRKQVRTRIEKFVSNGTIEQQGAVYKISEEYIKKMEVYAEAISKTISDLESKNEMAKKRPKKDQ
ncbi:ATP-dependent DNA helicase RecG [Flavobacterium arsenatis]|uniref:ATP-dependent DNA helicase RecG n=1 Tax=Flavobacterium arsenatis TaxID=1484332 RepID=A0ABU1TS73_9FLAO|nr:ATP-binding protein [Flavobacterium arsenatis]MDR6968731.1 ATP-dependent DNA helicase RecG [Flavobacterium arsenatis]